MDIRSEQQHLAPSTILGKPQSKPGNNLDEWPSIGFEYTAGDETLPYTLAVLSPGPGQGG